VALAAGKAAVPGLHPVLFHNNHTWTGHSPLVPLLQGLGVAAIFLFGVSCLAFVRAVRAPSLTLRLLLMWLAFHGIALALVQVPIGALLSGSDVGMAMQYLALGASGKIVAVVLSIAGLLALGCWLARRAVQFWPQGSALGSIHRVVTWPAILGTVLCIPYRVPREWLEVVALPLVVMAAAIGAAYAGAAVCSRGHGARAGIGGWTFSWPLLLALVMLLGAFQLVLRKGVAL
jgi:hypothetical protein